MTFSRHQNKTKQTNKNKYLFTADVAADGLGAAAGAGAVPLTATGGRGIDFESTGWARGWANMAGRGVAVCLRVKPEQIHLIYLGGGTDCESILARTRT